MKYRATAAAWFSTFLLKAFVSRVNRRMDIRIVTHRTQPAVADVSLRRPSGDYSAEDIINARPVMVWRSGENVAVKAEVAPANVLGLRLTRK